jgi:hypothetical protein
MNSWRNTRVLRNSKEMEDQKRRLLLGELKLISHNNEDIKSYLSNKRDSFLYGLLIIKYQNITASKQ